MFIGLIIVAIIAGILLVLIILAQNPKGGINNQLGAGSNVLGVKKTTDFLEKATWALAIVIIVGCVGATKFATKASGSDVDPTLKQALDGGKQIQQVDENTGGDEDFDFDDVEDKAEEILDTTK